VAPLIPATFRERRFRALDVRRMSYRHSVTGQTTTGGRKKARLTARPRRRGDRVKFRRREGLVTKSPIVKRSVKIDGRKTSVCLEDAFWTALKEIAAHQNISVEKLAFKVDRERQQSNLSSAIRLFVLDHYCQQAAARSVSPSRVGVQKARPTDLNSGGGTE